MIAWILIASIGGLISLSCLVILLRRYRRGDITQRYTIAMVVGYISFVSFAIISALRPEVASGWATITLLPAFISIVVLIRERKRASGSNE